MEPRDDDFARIARTLWSDLGHVEGTLLSIRQDLFTLSSALAQLPAPVAHPAHGLASPPAAPVVGMPPGVGAAIGAQAPASPVEAPSTARRAGPRGSAGAAPARAAGRPGAKPRPRRNGKD